MAAPWFLQQYSRANLPATFSPAAAVLVFMAETYFFLRIIEKIQAYGFERFAAERSEYDENEGKGD